MKIRILRNDDVSFIRRKDDDHKYSVDRVITEHDTETDNVKVTVDTHDESFNCYKFDFETPRVKVEQSEYGCTYVVNPIDEDWKKLEPILKRRQTKIHNL